ncbi:putative parvulin-type peptidyl-prolyl cis-trans isomerase precursor [mine drainage metagenome]|uniref:peptidylprolyl isomerase n=1 Tax=mine drainage metagenome TaxID=410659 RepID=A0A1J5SGB2_9ZZZZ
MRVAQMRPDFHVMRMAAQKLPIKPDLTCKERLMNRFLIRSSLVALAAILAIAPVLAKEDSGKAIATVNGKAIPKNRADALVAAQTAQGQADTPELRKAVREELIRREILAQEAVKKGFEKKPLIQGEMELARQSVLINAYMQDYVKNHPIGEDAIKKEYAAIKAQLGDKEYKARHILVGTEAEAKDIIAKLNKGEKFADLAKLSKDPGSKERGGDLGWATPSSYVKPFADALVKLQKGKFTETPVKTDFGYHVIMLDDTRELKLPSLEEAKPKLVQRLQQQMIEKHLLDLRNKAKVD